MVTKKIIHLDMDAFYASVEILDNPELKGLPVIVGGSSNRGVVSASSYEARKFGVYSAMPIMQARKLCPQGVFLPVRMSRYHEVSEQIMAIFHRYTPLVEPISLDEAFLDVTGSEKLMGSAAKIAKQIKSEVLSETGLTVSAGIASSKLVAKIASDLEKPNGLTIVETGDEQTFLAPLPIKRLWGVGKSTQEDLALLGARTIGDVSRLPMDLLQRKFGKHGLHLYYASQGIDDREVIPEREVKSVGNEETFNQDLTDPRRIKREFMALATKVGRRLRNHHLEGKTINIKIKYNDFKQITRSATLTTPTCDSKEIYTMSLELLTKTEAGTRPVRLIGVTVSNLQPHESREQLGLFGGGTEIKRRKQINRAVDSINTKYGGNIIIPGTLLNDDEEQES